MKEMYYTLETNERQPRSNPKVTIALTGQMIHELYDDLPEPDLEDCDTYKKFYALLEHLHKILRAGSLA